MEEQLKLLVEKTKQAMDRCEELKVKLKFEETRTYPAASQVVTNLAIEFYAFKQECYLMFIEIFRNQKQILEMSKQTGKE